MVKLRLYQIDAFTDRVFRGNPAAVVPLDDWLDDVTLQAIAAENNLSETAFFVEQGDRYHLRWFTPTQEVPLCGHATLASAYVIFAELAPDRSSIEFETLSGLLGVTRQADRFILDFPSRPPYACDPTPDLLEGLGQHPVKVLKTAADTNYYVVLEREAAVIDLHPDFAQLAALHPYGVVVTAPGQQSDFVCRYFAPSYGIPEDPVTGSIHCGLVPYWADRLGKTHLLSRQVSQRGGELYCELLGDRVAIGGQAVKYLMGEIEVAAMAE